MALGSSNGASMAAAVLLRPMLPLPPVALPDLGGRRVLMLTGASDAVIPAESTDRLEALLTAAGAQVERHVLAAGHGLTPADDTIAARWLADAAPPGISPETCLADCTV